MTQTFAPTAIRASEFSRCHRQAALRALGHEPDMHEAAAEYLRRGHLFEDYVIRQIEAKYGRDNVVRQPAFDWGMGEDGHSDVFITTDRALVEIKSTVTPTLSSPMIDMAIEQNKVGQVFYEHPEAGQSEVGYVYLIDPSRLTPTDVITVRVTDEDRERIITARDELRRSLEGGPLPARVCLKPGQARGRLCAFAAPCFEGWEPETPATITDPDVLDTVARLASIRDQMRAPKADLAELKEAEKEAQGYLSEVLDVGESTVGPYTVVRTHVQRSPVFKEKLARTAGFPVASLEEFFVPGAEYDTWKIRAAEEAGEIDYGEEAPF